MMRHADCLGACRTCNSSVRAVLSHLHQRGAEAVFAERGVLRRAVLVAVLEFLQDVLAEHAFALAVDEYNAAALAAGVLVHDAAKFVHLRHQHIAVAET